jgi:hypothetical protein
MMRGRSGVPGGMQSGMPHYPLRVTVGEGPLSSPLSCINTARRGWWPSGHHDGAVRAGRRHP